tara:strand:- start:324 stop:560 length:237 start_codon:yes stop_codon:yes gene_type:complete
MNPSDEERIIETMRLALRSAEADIEGIIEVDLVGVEHPIHQTLVEIQDALAKVDERAWEDEPVKWQASKKHPYGVERA